jgi:DNA invertase Pin-like site-specific DNA recombinase
MLDELTNDLNRTYKYLRVSTEEQAKSGLGREAQLARINWYCLGNAEKLPPVLDEPFVDDGVSSTVPFLKRKAGAALHQRLRKGDHVIAALLDRVGRDVRDIINTIEMWDQLGVTIHLLDVAGCIVDTQTAMGKFMIGMLALFAQFERDKISERTRVALAAWKARGAPTKKLSCRMGYRRLWDKSQQKRVPTPIQSELDQMKLIWDMRQSGIPFKEIRCQLNQAKNYRVRWRHPPRASGKTDIRKTSVPWGIFAVVNAYLWYLVDHPELFKEARFKPAKRDIYAARAAGKEYAKLASTS